MTKPRTAHPPVFIPPNSTFLTFADAYRCILSDCFVNYDYSVNPRGMWCREKQNVIFTITDPLQQLFDNEVRDLPRQYLARELSLYLGGVNLAYRFAKASKFWDKIKNPDGTVNSAYGHILFCENMFDKEKNQRVIPGNRNLHSAWIYALGTLVKDQYSRQAVLHINQRKHLIMKDSKDIPCTMSLVFSIRDNQLNLTVHMRSNDVIKGTTFDIPAFMVFQQAMWLSLREIAYPDLNLGTYTHFVDSLHLYESNFELAEKMLRKPFTPKSLPLLDNGKIVLDKSVTEIGMFGKYKIKPTTNIEFIEWLNTTVGDFD